MRGTRIIGQNLGDCTTIQIQHIVEVKDSAAGIILGSVCQLKYVNILKICKGRFK